MEFSVISPEPNYLNNVIINIKETPTLLLAGAYDMTGVSRYITHLPLSLLHQPGKTSI
jgi:hypothetical protein